METIRALIERLKEQSDRHAPSNELLATVNVLQSALQESLKENIKQVRSGNISVVFPSANRLVNHTPPPAGSSREEVVGWRVKQSPEAVAERDRAQAEAERQRAAAVEAENQRRADEDAALEIERRQVASREAERQRVAQEAERQRAADQEAERQRIAAQDAERQRYVAQESERQRVAAQEAERQRFVSQEADRQRAAAEEAERQRFAAQEAERQRIARDNERQRYAALEAESQRLADAENERQRIAAQQIPARPVADNTRQAKRDFSSGNFWQGPADQRSAYEPEAEKWQPAAAPEIPDSNEPWQPKEREEELHNGYRPPMNSGGSKISTQQEMNLRERNDVFGQASSLNDRHRSEQQEVGSALNDEPVKDLRKAIGINDRFVFLSELFRGDEVMYERSLKTINNFRIFPEAEYWIERELKVKLGWDESKSTVKHFRQLVRRRFLG